MREEGGRDNLTCSLPSPPLSSPLLPPIHAVSELDVLEPCQFTSRVAFPHKLRKEYEGVYQVNTQYEGVYQVNTQYEGEYQVNTQYEGVYQVNTQYEGVYQVNTQPVSLDGPAASSATDTRTHTHTHTLSLISRSDKGEFCIS